MEFSSGERLRAGNSHGIAAVVRRAGEDGPAGQAKEITWVYRVKEWSHSG
jgi:hypothetical protein